ncbi:phosphatidylserine decarboxylase [Campylobacter sp. MIT 99-7217]|uniref:phosphatidylserine decarboxylase n=1 Tax=Campylobacter sp. MIT 99-7217 TaxID=535091 RepID=UPI001157F733|nr:phosphatidylserine decarboxylase [Campylobacter sp. MIT 99-7217]TQR33785.1 phosphatidylserine decarboxylase [Campylobacter sp. MIT 99-7217]
MSIKNFISRAGIFPLSLYAVFFILVWIFYSFSWVLFFLFLLLLWIYKNPERIALYDDKKAILSPIDAELLSIKQIIHHDFGECIELNFKNAFYQNGTIRASLDMQIQEIKARHGLFLSPKFDLPLHLNERLLIIAQNKEKRKFGLRICAGCLDRKIKFYNNSTEFKGGEELGFSVNGIISLLLPKDTAIKIGVGDSVKACSLIGYFS